MVLNNNIKKKIIRARIRMKFLMQHLWNLIVMQMSGKSNKHVIKLDLHSKPFAMFGFNQLKLFVLVLFLSDWS